MGADVLGKRMLGGYVCAEFRGEGSMSEGSFGALEIPLDLNDEAKAMK
jgi:hypothetical protein